MANSPTTSIPNKPLDVLRQLQDRLGLGGGALDPLTQAQVVLLGGLSAIGSDQLRVLREISAKLGAGVPQYAEGTPYVPHSMLARVHVGERIIPASQNLTHNINVHASGDVPAGHDFASRVADQVISRIVRGGGRYGTVPIVVKR